MAKRVWKNGREYIRVKLEQGWNKFDPLSLFYANVLTPDVMLDVPSVKLAIKEGGNIKGLDGDCCGLGLIQVRVRLVVLNTQAIDVCYKYI